jgi:hypothetical protein
MKVIPGLGSETLYFADELYAGSFHFGSCLFDVIDQEAYYRASPKKS